MTRPTISTLLWALLLLFALFYLAGAALVAVNDYPIDASTPAPVGPRDIAIFGASGTAGDGILKAAAADPQVRKIHIFTRRSTPRIAQAVASGRAEMTLHMDYLDYSALRAHLTDIDTVYWAIGISSLGADEETYGRIHVDFPLQFVRTWTAVNDLPDISFHFISSSDISEDSDTMWIRQKIRAEKTLFAFAEGTPLRVIAYRPDYIGPTAETAQPGQDILYYFFRPVGAAVRATEIGKAMLEITARGADFDNGAKVSTAGIVGYAEAYDRRHHP